MSNKRVRGLAIHRPILYGSTSTPLTPAEKLAAPPDHTHKWTVAVRSAASHPLPSLSTISGLAANNANVEPGSELAATNAANAAAGTSSTTAPAASAPIAAGASASISTRGRDVEHDYHKMVGGKDDLSHFIKRVQFKLHDTYPQPTRNIDKPPYCVTETGWGEFEIQIKIFFVPEANEKPITLFHHLKLHPWLASVAAVESEQPPPPSIPAPLPPADTSAPPTTATDAAEPSTTVTTETSAESIKEQSETTEMDVDPVGSANGTETGMQSEAAGGSGTATTVPAAPKPALPPVVHSWQYDEIVFPEPMEAFYDILSTHPPTQLAVTSALAFADPAAYRSYQYALSEADRGASSGPAPIPPHPLHTPTGYLFDALSLEAQQAEGDRLDMARVAAIRDLESGREQLIRAERALKDARNRITTLNNALIASATAANTAPGVPTNGAPQQAM